MVALNTSMTNQEYADALVKVAGAFRNADSDAVERPRLYFFPTTKAELLRIIRMFGGSWTKRTDPDGSSYPTIRLESKALPICISIQRDICRKTVRFDCEPLFSPEDHAKIEEVIA